VAKDGTAKEPSGKLAGKGLQRDARQKSSPPAEPYQPPAPAAPAKSADRRYDSKTAQHGGGAKDAADGKRAKTQYPSSRGRAPLQPKIKAEETIDDIKAEIVRIEKEIELEIKEIQSRRLAL
jgi:hypothetical protein